MKELKKSKAQMCNNSWKLDLIQGRTHAGQGILVHQRMTFARKKERKREKKKRKQDVQTQIHH